MNENEDSKYQNLYNVANAALRGKFVVLNAYINKEYLKPII